MKRMLTVGIFLGLALSAQAMGYNCSNQQGTKVKVTYYRLTQVEVIKNEIKTNYILNINEDLFLAPDYSEAVGSLKIEEFIKPIDFSKCGRTRLGCPEFPPVFYLGTLTLNNQTENLTCSAF